jgi:hypothetical protein
MGQKKHLALSFIIVHLQLKPNKQLTETSQLTLLTNSQNPALLGSTLHICTCFGAVEDQNLFVIFIIFFFFGSFFW